MIYSLIHCGVGLPPTLPTPTMLVVPLSSLPWFSISTALRDGQITSVPRVRRGELVGDHLPLVVENVTGHKLGVQPRFLSKPDKIFVPFPSTLGVAQFGCL